MKMNKTWWVLGLVALFPACQPAASDDKGDSTLVSLGSQAPDDTTGVNAPVNLTFGSSGGAALGLDAVEGSELDLGGGLLLSYAKFNIAKIKIKAPKEVAEGEKELDSEEATEEVKAASDFEDASGMSKEDDDDDGDGKDGDGKGDDKDGEGDDKDGDGKNEDGAPSVESAALADGAGSADTDADGTDTATGSGDDASPVAGDDDDSTVDAADKDDDKDAAEASDTAKPEEGKKGEHGKEHHKQVAEHRDEFRDHEDQANDEESDRDPSTKFRGPYVFNAIAGEIEGDNVPQIEIPDGSYRRIQFQLKRNFTAEEGDPLLGNVFAIRGTVEKDGAAVPFAIDWHHALNFRMRSNGDSAFVVSAGDENALVIDLDLTKWFKDVDLSGATVDADGTIYVDRHSNRALMRQLRKNMKTSCRFGKDHDKDGKLSESETAGEGEETSDASEAVDTPDAPVADAADAAAGT